MQKLTTTGLGIGGAIVGALLFSGIALGSSHYTLFGGAEIVPEGNPGNAAALPSNADEPFSGVEVNEFPATAEEITEISFDYNSDVAGNSGGSPRLVIEFSDGNIAELRPLELEEGTWVTLDGATGTNWDLRGGSCGFVYGTDWANVLECTDGASIEAVRVVNDSGWLYPDGITVLVDNITINDEVITFDDDDTGNPGVATDKEDCKKGGWETLTREDGSTFKNQGACVSYVNTGR